MLVEPVEKYFQEKGNHLVQKYPGRCGLKNYLFILMSVYQHCASCTYLNHSGFCRHWQESQNSRRCYGRTKGSWIVWTSDPWEVWWDYRPAYDLKCFSCCKLMVQKRFASVCIGMYWLSEEGGRGEGGVRTGRTIHQASRQCQESYVQ